MNDRRYDWLRRAWLKARVRVVRMALGLLTVCALWGVVSLAPGSADDKTAANYQQIATYYSAGQQALYAAEAGAEEARARLRLSPGFSHSMVDHEPYNPAWQIAIRPQTDSDSPGHDSLAPGSVVSLQGALTYHVTIRHATHPSHGVLRWGDRHGDGVSTRNTSHGQPIYVLTSRGVYDEAQRMVEVEVAPEPPPTVPAALYAAGPVRLHNPRTVISGMDLCGEQHQPGIRTPLTPAAVGHRPIAGPAVAAGQYGNAVITGTPALIYHSPQLQVQHMVETLQERADVVYSATSTVGHAAQTPVSWGHPKRAPALQSPSTCEAQQVIAYHVPAGTGVLPPGSVGCGVLLVAGDLVIQGDFTWYGAVLITGSVHLTGGGDKHLTGGMVVGGGVTMDADGHTSLLYCSTAVLQQTRSMPLRVLSWREVTSVAQ